MTAACKPRLHPRDLVRAAAHAAASVGECPYRDKGWRTFWTHEFAQAKQITIFEKLPIEESRMTDQQIEQEIQAKGKTAPRITPDDIEANIVHEHYFTAGAAARSSASRLVFESGAGASRIVHPSLDLLTICVMVLRNGFTVTGESACASPENFDAEIGRKIARANAVQKIWSLEGYLLREKLWNHGAGPGGDCSSGD